MLEYIWIILIIAFASLIKGMTGFGFSLISLPPLTLWFSAKEIIPVLIICNLIASGLIVIQKKERNLVSRNFKILIVYGGVFTGIGTVFLKYIQEELLITVLSIFFILTSLISLLGVTFRYKPGSLSYKIAGAIVGLLTGITSISGPPLAIFLHYTDVDNQEFREIFSWFNIITPIISIVLLGSFGLMNLQTLKMTTLFLPILFLGSFFGKKLNHAVPGSIFKNMILIITLMSGIWLLVK